MKLFFAVKLFDIVLRSIVSKITYREYCRLVLIDPSVKDYVILKLNLALK